MSWATRYIEELKKGNTVKFRPRGNSMQGRIKSGQLCTVEPIVTDADLKPNEIVLCKVNGGQYLHLIKAVKGRQFQIGNNKGRINGWTSRANIFGRLTAIGE